jgi:hypothetical protein
MMTTIEYLEQRIKELEALVRLDEMVIKDQKERIDELAAALQLAEPYIQIAAAVAWSEAGAEEGRHGESEWYRELVEELATIQADHKIVRQALQGEGEEE